jgi:hypothetical protein
MRKLAIFILMVFALSSTGCFKKESEGIKLSKEPFDKSKCALYMSTAKEARLKNEMHIVDALRNYNDLCFFNTDKLKEQLKKPAMPTPR